MRMASYITFNCVNTLTKIADKLRYTNSFFFLGDEGLLLVETMRNNRCQYEF